MDLKSQEMQTEILRGWRKVRVIISASFTISCFHVGIGQIA